MTQNPVAIGNHILLYRDGDTLTVAGAIPGNATGAPISTPAARLVRPAAADTKWVDIGAIVDLSVDRQSDEKEVYAPTPGQLRRYDVIPVKQAIDISLTALEMSNLAFELIFGSQAITGGGFTYAPLSNTSGNIVKKFWCQLQQYTHADVLFQTLYLYGYMDFDGPVDFKDDVVQTKLKFRSIHSTLNVGTVA